MAFLLNKAEFLTDVDKNSWKLWTTEWKVVTLGIGFHLLGLYYSPRFARGCKADPRGENRSLVQLLFTQWFTVFTRFSQHQLGNETISLSIVDSFKIKSLLQSLIGFWLRGADEAAGLVTLSLCCIVRRQKIILTDIFSSYQTSLQDASLVEHMDYQHLIN